MISRCYNQNDDDYSIYGGIGVTVDPRWHNFTIFLHDVMFLPGYENKIKYPDIYQLDKDYLQFNVPKAQRVYSPSTCIWLSKHDNVMVMQRDKETFSGYYGVHYKNNTWYVTVDKKTYYRFTTASAVVNMFNYLYPIAQKK